MTRRQQQQKPVEVLNFRRLLAPGNADWKWNLFMRINELQRLVIASLAWMAS